MSSVREVPVVDSSPALGERLARRDERALEEAYEAYEAYAPSLLSYLRRYVGPDEAEDVMQRTFLDAWRSAPRFRTGERFSGWLFTIAHRRAVDTLRSRRATVVAVDEMRDLVGEDGRETVERYADAADVQTALTQLPEQEREVLVLAYFHGLTQREIAERLDVPLGTVKTRASRGTTRLRTLVAAASPTSPTGGQA